MEQAVPVDLCLERHEDRAQADRGTVHEHNFARRAEATQVVRLEVYLVGKPGAVDAAFALHNPLRLALQKRRVKQSRPDVQRALSD